MADTNLGTEVYVPGLVPQSGETKDVERFLAEELQRISLAIRSTSVAAAYGGIKVDTPQTDTANIIPHQITDWDEFYPPRPSRIVSNPPGYDSLVMLEDGAYQADTQVNVVISSGTTYYLTMHVNGVASSTLGAWDTSNQTGQIWMTFGGLVPLSAGDEVSVWVAADANGQIFDIQSANFQIYRVSEILNNEP